MLNEMILIVEIVMSVISILIFSMLRNKIARFRHEDIASKYMSYVIMFSIFWEIGWIVYFPWMLYNLARCKK